MVYARGLATEGGFNYNAGVPETGMTSPLWVVLLAGVRVLVAADAGGAGAAAVSGESAAATLRVVVGAKLLALLFGLAGIVALHRLALALGEGPRVAFLAAALAALDPSLTFSRAAGMEVPLFVLLALCALLAAVRGRVAAAGGAVGLAVVARPEGAVLVPLVFALLARGEARRRAGFPRRLALAALLAAAPALAYALFCLHATGVPLPNTFYAKFVAQNPLSLDALVFGWRHYVRGNLPYFTLEAGAVLALLGAVRLARRRGLVGLAPIAAGALLFVSALASRRFAPGHFYYWERWLIPTVPFLLLAVASGVGEIAGAVESLRGSARPSRARAASAGREARAGGAPPHGRRLAWSALAAAALALAAWRVPAALRERAATYAWNNQNIEEMNVALGRWVDANVPREVVVGVNDAGALRYFGRHTTIDLLGLNDHRILRRDAGAGTRILDDLGVRCFVIFPTWFPEAFLRSLALVPLHEVRSPHYTICDGPQDVMVVYRSDR
jgi:hypothetical protein